MKREIPDFTVFQGYEHTILPALAIGAAGGFAILMNALPKEYVKLYDLVKRNKWEEAAALCSDCSERQTSLQEWNWCIWFRSTAARIRIEPDCNIAIDD